MARVLLIDDEPDILLMLRIAMESTGHEVGLAGNGQEGLEAIAAGDFDVVLSDMMMPVLDGWGLLQAAALLPSPPPIIVVSAKAGPDDVRRALDAGAVDFVSKPFSPFDLVDLIERLADCDAAGLQAHRAARYP